MELIGKIDQYFNLLIIMKKYPRVVKLTER